MGQDLAFNWPTSASVAANVQHDEISALLSQINGYDPDLSGLPWEFRFVALSEGKVYLLVANSTRSSYRDLTAIYCEQSRCFLASVDAGVNLKDDVVDVDGDGFPEIIGEECVYDCSAGLAIPRLPICVYSIYKFVEGTGFVDYSGKAANYYQEHLLPEIEAARSEIEVRVAQFNQEHGDFLRRGDRLFPPAGQLEGYKAAVQYAYDDYLRRVQGEKDAGLENALRWIESDYTRDLGLETLARIANPVADAKLAEAARSTDVRFAEQAARLLEFHGRLRSRGLLK